MNSIQLIVLGVEGVALSVFACLYMWLLLSRVRAAGLPHCVVTHTAVSGVIINMRINTGAATAS